MADDIINQFRLFDRVYAQKCVGGLDSKHSSAIRQIKLFVEDVSFVCHRPKLKKIAIGFRSVRMRCAFCSAAAFAVPRRSKLIWTCISLVLSSMNE